MFDEKINNLKLEISELEFSNHEISEKVTAISSENEEIKAEIEKLKNSDDENKNKIERLKSDISEHEIIYMNSENSLQILRDSLEKLKNEMSGFEKIRYLSENIDFTKNMLNFISDYEKMEAFISFLEQCVSENETIRKVKDIFSARKDSDAGSLFEMTFEELKIKSSNISESIDNTF